jgi:hypothetical protein
VTDDAACLTEAGGDFEAMVRSRLSLLSLDRLSASRVEGLRANFSESVRFEDFTSFYFLKEIREKIK